MMNFKKIFIKNHKLLSVIFILSFIFSYGDFLKELPAKNKSCDIHIINNRNIRVDLVSEIADTYESQIRGLMFRQRLENNSGMLFVFADESRREFWMKNTYIPLDIAYISAQGIINEIYYMKPLDISVTYPSKKPSMYVLEVNQNWFKNNNITEGCRIYFNGCFSK